VYLSSSSDEEGLISNTSRDEKFIKKLSSDLNCDILGPPSDSKIIILSDSDEEEEVHKEEDATAEAAHSSAVGIPASTTSTANADEAPMGVQDGNSGDRTPDRETGSGSNGGDEDGSP
jgi:hypothetical protein